jgi:hypothetical protein
MFLFLHILDTSSQTTHKKGFLKKIKNKIIIIGNACINGFNNYFLHHKKE